MIWAGGDAGTLAGKVVQTPCAAQAIGIEGSVAGKTGWRTLLNKFNYLFFLFYFTGEQAFEAGKY